MLDSGLSWHWHRDPYHRAWSRVYTGSNICVLSQTHEASSHAEIISISPPPLSRWHWMLEYIKGMIIWSQDITDYCGHAMVTEHGDLADHSRHDNLSHSNISCVGSRLNHKLASFILILSPNSISWWHTTATHGPWKLVLSIFGKYKKDKY